MFNNALLQTEIFIILLFAQRADKMRHQILCFEWLPERAIYGWPYNLTFTDQSLFSQGSWIIASFFFDTTTSSRSIKSEWKNLANIKPFWNYVWSITHMCKQRDTKRYKKEKNVFKNSVSDRHLLKKEIKVFYPTNTYTWIFENRVGKNNNSLYYLAI